ncbi:hypothetical protein M4U16_004939 [Salmonella enterica]|nr:hypothetical protein [Salmonella enterica]EJE2134738.1 hypothetical protein [Salmonella enterica]EKC8670039.1 hypothetical protein [Salmonella enterica]
MKYIKSDIDWRKVFVFLAMAAYGFLRVLTRSIMMMPAMLIVALAIAFYFAPEQLLSDVINTWSSASTDEKITMIRIFLKGAFLLSFAACFLDTLITYPRYPVANVLSAKGEHKL